MKKSILILLVVFCLHPVLYGQGKAKVDERFELTSIVFALADAKEYNQCLVPSYKDDIQAYFSEFNSSAPIEYVKQLRMQGIGYDAVSTTAEMLEIVDGTIRLQAGYDMARISETDRRWDEKSFSKYLKMLNRFYRESDFHTFFKAHGDLYRSAEECFDACYEGRLTDWFSSFFGAPIDADIQVYLSLCNGPSNYAMPHGILIGVMTDREGVFRFDDYNTLFVLLHEFGHHYSGPLFEAYWPQMKQAAEKIYPSVAEQMHRSAYSGAYTTCNEWLNNLLVSMYFREYRPSEYRGIIGSMMKRGFIWMVRSAEFMDNFYANRELYPHIDDFMPQLVGFLDFTADQFDFVLDEYEHRRPYIKSVFPACGTDITDVTEIIVTFSEPMIKASGFEPVDDPAVKVPLHNYVGVRWSDDFRQVILKMDPSKAEPKSTYGFRLRPEWFQSQNYFYLDDKSNTLIFKTR